MPKHEPVKIQQTELYAIPEIEIKKFLAGVTDLSYESISRATVAQSWVNTHNAEIMFQLETITKDETKDDDLPF